MKIKLVNNWFAPGSEWVVDKLRTFSGRRYAAGVHIVPDSLFEHLPKSAVVLEQPAEKEVEAEIPVPVARGESLKDFDGERAAAMVEADVQNKTHDNLAKARAAKKAKAQEK